MRLAGVNFGNFRAFSGGGFEVPDRGLMFVVGANNSGKSALLSSLDVIAGRGPEAGIPSQGSFEPGRIDAIFDLTDREINEMMPRRQPGLIRDILRQVCYTFAATDEDSPARLVEISGSWGSHGMFPIVAYEDRENFVGQVRWSEWGSAGPLQEPPGLINSFGSQESDFESYVSRSGSTKPLRNYLEEWRRGLYHFSSLRTGGERDAPLRASSVLQPDGSNIHEVLIHLRNNEPAKFAEISDTLARIVPGVGELTTPVSGDSVQVALIGTNNGEHILNIKDLGSGVEQLLLTLTVGIQNLGSDLLVLEEPETNLHPAAQRSLGVFLRKVSVDRTIVVATHSPVLLDWRFQTDSVLLTRRDAEGSTVEKVADEPFEVLEELGVRLSDVLAAERLLIVEGPTDVAILREWLGDLLLDARFAVAEGGGGDNARHAKLLQRWAAAADGEGRRRILYLRDRDELPEQEISKLQESGAVAVLPRREIENYFLDSEVLQKHFGHLPEVNGTPSLGDIEQSMRLAAQSVRRQMVIGRVSRSLASIRFVDHKARKQLVKDQVNRKGLADYAVARIPSKTSVRAEIATAWVDAETEVSSMSEVEIFHFGPGEEMLGSIFQQFAHRNYSKRSDGVALARLAPVPEEVLELLKDFRS